MNFENILFNVFFKFRVIHSIPGRIRIHIPFSHTIPREWVQWLDNSDFLLGIPGIESVSFSKRTGNALIHYQPQVLAEEDILQTLHRIAEILKDNREALQRAANQGQEQAAEYLLKLLDIHFGSPSPPTADSLRSE